MSTLLQDPARLTPKYFRVSYFGKKCGELHGKGFIYRVGGGTSLHAFTAQVNNICVYLETDLDLFLSFLTD